MCVKSYRFRLVSLSCDPAYTLSIDGHELTVIEADGIETHPVTVNAIQIFAAQRYSFVVSSSEYFYCELELKESDSCSSPQTRPSTITGFAPTQTLATSGSRMVSTLRSCATTVPTWPSL